MSHLVYLASLLIGIGGLLIIDRRLRLAFWYDQRRTVRTLVPAYIIFLLWDIAGIILGIFAHGSSMFSLPFVIAPQFPIEELFFLFLLSYLTLLLYAGSKRGRQR